MSANAQQIEPPGPTWRQRCARHEAGHVIICLALGIPLAGAEISASGGRTWPESNAQSQNDAISALPEMVRVIGRPPPSVFSKFRDQIILCLAGGVAEDLMNAPPRDLYNAADQIEARLRAELVTYSGRGARTFLDYCEQECRAILGQHWSSVEAIAVALLERGSLDGDQLRAVWLNSKRPDAMTG
jgi:hypothetical protein